MEKNNKGELKLLYYTKGEGQFLFRNETTKEKKTRKYHHMHREFAIVESLYIYIVKRKKKRIHKWHYCSVRCKAKVVVLYIYKKREYVFKEQ